MYIYIGFVATQLARQLHQERRGAVIGKPGSTRLENTPAMDNGINSKHIQILD